MFYGHGITTDQALQMDRWTVANVYFRPRDRMGKLLGRPTLRQAPKSPRQEYLDYWAALGVPAHRAEVMHAEELAAQEVAKQRQAAEVARLRENRTWRGLRG